MRQRRGSRSTSPCRGRLFKLKQLRIDECFVRGNQLTVDAALAAIEEPTLDQVHPKKPHGGTRRHPIPDVELERPAAVHPRAEKASATLADIPPLSRPVNLRRLELRITQMTLDECIEALEVLVHERITEKAWLPVEKHVLVHEAILVAARASPEQPELVVGVPPRVL